MTNPMPPNQLRSCLQKRMAWGRDSKPPSSVLPPRRRVVLSRMEAPVVLKPEAASKMASEKWIRQQRMKGRAPRRMEENQAREMVRNP